MAGRRWVAAILLVALVFGACTSGSDAESDAAKASPSPSNLSIDEFSDAASDLCVDVVDAYKDVVTEKNVTRLGVKLGKFGVVVRNFSRKLGKFNVDADLALARKQYLNVLQRLVEASRAALGHPNRKAKEITKTFAKLGRVQLELLGAREHAHLPISCELATRNDALFTQFIGAAVGDCLNAIDELNKRAPDGIPSSISESASLYGALASTYHSLADDLRTDIPPHLAEAKKIERLTDLTDQLGDVFDRGVTAINGLDIGTLNSVIDEAETLGAKARKISKDVELADCAGAFFT